MIGFSNISALLGVVVGAGPTGIYDNRLTMKMA